MDVAGVADVRHRAPGIGRITLVLALAACSGKTTTPKTAVEDARGSQLALQGDAADPAAAGDGIGDVHVRVEWKDVPVGARATPGRTACNTPRPPAVAPTTLWAIPEVFVAIAAPGTTTRAAQRITLAGCTLSPRAVVTSGSVTVASASESPAKLVVQRAGTLPLGGTLSDDKARDLYLPVAGHQVSIALDAGAIYRISGADDAWVVASDSPFVAVTDAGGSATLRGIPTGTHEVVAWLPARSGQPARVARAKVTVTTGSLADVTVDLTKQ